MTTYGDDAVLVELPDLGAVRVLDAALRAEPVSGVVDVVPAARTVLVRGDARTRAVWAAAVARAAADGLRSAAPAVVARTVEVPVVYDGEDLEDVARLTGTSVEEVVARHLAGGPGGYRVAFGGFMPGFAYVVGLDPRLHVARLAAPRTRVPPGAVAVAGEYTAVYPAATPGGWRLLGTTSLAVFDVARDPAALLAPGDAVRFVRVPPPPVPAAARAGSTSRAVPGGTDDRPHGPGLTDAGAADGGRDAGAADGSTDAGVADGGGDAGAVDGGADAGAADGGRDAGAADGSTDAGAADGGSGAGAADGGRDAGAADGGAGATDGGGDAGATAGSTPAVRALTVVAPGLLTLVEDAGRPGLAAVGVPRSGVADPAAAVRVNRLVGNARDAAVLEVLLGGLVVTFGATTAIALVGADPGADLDGVPVPTGVPVRAPAGSTLTLGTPPRGARTWLTVRGGVEVPPVLGSRSRDVLSGLGPAPLRRGDVLPYGARFDGLPDVGAHTAWTGADGPADPSALHVVDLPATPGPRVDRLDAAGAARLWEQVWDVTPDSNRVAVRLAGAPLTFATHDELPSEGLVPGAVQVPHDGRPVVFGPDHPVTGGYPVVAVLTGAGLARAAQLRPGDRVRLTRA